MKKYLVILMAVCMIFSCCACGASSSPDAVVATSEPVVVLKAPSPVAGDSTGTEVPIFPSSSAKTVSVVNCTLQYLDSSGNPAGDKYTQIDFGTEYTVPTTNQLHPAGTVSFTVTANSASGKVVDVWVINGVSFRFPTPTESITILDLDYSISIEVSYKDEEEPDQAVPAHEHNYTITPMDSGNHAFRCKDCGAGFTEKHVPVTTPVNSTSHQIVCRECGLLLATESHVFTNAIDRGDVIEYICDYCSYVRTESIPDPSPAPATMTR